MKHLEKVFIESLIIFLFIAGCNFKTKNKIDLNIKDNFDPEWGQNPIWDDGQA